MKKRSKAKTSFMYAKAWYDVVIENKMLEEAFIDAKKLEGVFASDDVKKILSPTVPQSSKEQIISEVAKNLELNPETHSLLQTLVGNKSLSYIDNILGEFKSLYYKYNGIEEVCVQTVKMLSKSQEEELKKNLKHYLNKDIVLSYDIKPSIIGGLVIMYGAYRIDDSVLGKLKHIEAVMKGDE